MDMWEHIQHLSQIPHGPREPRETRPNVPKELHRVVHAHGRHRQRTQQLAQGTDIAQSPLLSNAYHIMQLTLILWGVWVQGGCGHTLLQCLLQDALVETELAAQSRELL